MRRFAQDRALMAAKESRRIIALYNRVARALVEYEFLWHAEWLRSVHAARAALDCTLILKDAATGAPGCLWAALRNNCKCCKSPGSKSFGGR